MKHPIPDSLLYDACFGLALEDLAQRALDETGATGTAIALKRDAIFVCSASRGETAPPIGAIVDSNSGLTGVCLRDGVTVISGDTVADPQVDAAACEELGISSLIAVPVIRDGDVIGVIEALSNQPNAFGQEQQQLLENLAQEIPDRSAGAGWMAAVPHIVELPERQPDSGNTPDTTLAASQVPDQNVEIPTLTFTGQPIETEVKSTAQRRRVRRAVLTPTIAFAVLGASLFLYSHSEKGPTTPSATSAVSAPSAPPESPHIATHIQPQSDVEPSDAGPDTDIDSLEQAARAGDASSQLELADHLARGEGISKDPVTACVWYTLANMAGRKSTAPQLASITKDLSAAQIARVRIQVGQMFANGVGVKRDLVSAYSWFVLAASAGSAQATDYEDTLASEMTQKQISEARQRASNWLARHHFGTPDATSLPTAANRPLE